MKKASKILLGVAAAVPVLVVLLLAGGTLYYAYGRWSAKETTARALQGYVVGSPPNDVTVRIESQSAEKISGLLRGGFEVEVMDSIPFSYRSFEMAVRRDDGFILQCDLYHDPWRLTCWDWDRS